MNVKHFILAVLMAAILLFTCAVCAEDSDLNVITIDISDVSAAMRDGEIAEDDPRGRTEEQSRAAFNAAIEYLSHRTEQEFPEVEVKNTLRVIDYPDGKVYTLGNDDAENIIYYIHGGAWVLGIDPQHIAFCDEMATRLNAKVYMPLYPLAPEANAEASYAMVTEVYKDLLKQEKPIFIMGDSAGGTIVMGLTLELKDAGVKLPDKVMVMAPCADITFSNPDIPEIAKRDVILDPIFCRSCGSLWADDLDLRNQKFSPLNGDYAGFPDTLMFVGTYDILYADDMLLAQKMNEAGVNIQIVQGNGFWHVFPLDSTPEQPEFYRMIVDFCLN